jgi:hypothetical protein
MERRIFIRSIIQIDSGINIFDSRCGVRKAYGAGVPEIREYEQIN